MRRRARPTGGARKTIQRAPVTGFPAQLTPCVVFRVRATSRSARRAGTARCRQGGDAPTADPLHAGDRPVGPRHSFVAAPLTCEIGRRRAEIAVPCRFDGQASAWLVRMDRDSCTRREAPVPCGSCQPPSECSGRAPMRCYEPGPERNAPRCRRCRGRAPELVFKPVEQVIPVVDDVGLVDGENGVARLVGHGRQISVAVERRQRWCL
jgi:hypothetical protein